MAITEYYNNLRQLIHLNLQVPVYSESTFENQNVSLPCIVFSRDGTLGSQTMSGPSVMTETVTFSAKAKTIEKAEEMRAFIISILNGYDNEIQMVINSEVDEFEIDLGIYTRAISFDVVYGADIPYRNVVIGEGAASQIAIWQDRYILTGSNVMTITGSTVTFTGSVVVNGSLTVAGGFVAQNAVSASYALTSSYAASALTASYALNVIAGSSGTSGTSGANGSSGTSGTNGSSGTSGTNGTNGSSGTSGTNGTNGSSGTSGQNGSSGTSGTNGSSGTSGITPTSMPWDNITNISTSSSFAGTASYANTALTSSYVKGNVSASFIQAEQILITGNVEQIISGNVKLPNTLTAKDVTIPSGGSIINNGSFTSLYGTAQFGDLTATSITSSLQGTASYASFALTASYALNASGGSGSSGTSGLNGSSGTSGANGSSGTSGLTGSSGTSGISGSSGTSGTNGSSGTSGQNGSSGTSGANGINGSSGTSGQSGSSGTSGTNGIDGSSGTSGESGSSGTSGTSGANGSSGTSGLTQDLSGYVVTASGALNNLTASYALTSSYLDTTSLVLNNLTVNNSITASNIEAPTGGDLYLFAEHTAQIAVRFTDSSSIWFNDADGNPEIWMTDANNAETAYIRNTGSYLEISPNNINAVKIGQTDVIFNVPITGSLEGTASYATIALSASYAPGSPSVSASYAETASYSERTEYVFFDPNYQITRIGSGIGTGSTGVIIGQDSDDLGTGIGNTFIGNQVNQGADGSGSWNVIVGDSVSMADPNDTNCIIIGSSTYGKGSNTTVIGIENITTDAYIYGLIHGLITSASYAETASYAMNGGGAPSATASYLLGNASSSHIDFAQTVNSAEAVGRLTWNSDLGTLKLGLVGGNVNIPLGQEEVAYVYNAEATTLNKGEVVYVSGSVTDRIAVKRANANADATSARTLGIVAENITSAGSGYITTRGLLKDVDTSGYTAGDILYLATSSGAFTNIKPQAPVHLVYVGVVTRVGVGNGSIFTLIQNGYELDEIHDVRITSLTDGQMLVRSGSLWINSNNLLITGSNVFLNTSTGFNNLDLNNAVGNVVINTTGSNTIISGSSNIMIGQLAGKVLTNGSENILIGGTAGQQLTTETRNTIIGIGALRFGAGSNSHTGIGYQALRNVSTGDNSVAIGYQAATGSTTGNNLVVIGTLANVSAGSDSNSIVIGYQAVGSGSNTVVIGNTSITDTYLRGRVSAGSFTGSLQGTSSYSTQGLSASFASTSISSSYSIQALSASFASTTISSSYSIQTLSASFASSAISSSYSTQTLTASYALSSAGGGGSGVISSSAQLTNGQGFAFDSTSNVTFGQVTASNANITSVTASVILVDGYNQFGTSSADVHNFIGNVYITGSLNVSGGFNFSVGTASYALTALTASYALNASGGTTSSYFSSSALIIDTTPKAFITVATKYIATHSMDFKVSSFYDAELTGSLFVTASNLESGRTAIMRFFMSGSSTSSFAMNVPANWTYIGGVRPTALTGNRYSILSLTCFGSREQDVICGFSFSP